MYIKLEIMLKNLTVQRVFGVLRYSLSSRIAFGDSRGVFLTTFCAFNYNQK